MNNKYEYRITGMASGILFNETCPVCKTKHFLHFVTHSVVNCGLFEYVESGQKNANNIKCKICNTTFEIPPELKKVSE